MAEVIAFLSNSLVTIVLVGYVVIMWLALTVWAGMDIFSRTNSWIVRLGTILLVGLGFIFGFVLYLIIRPQSTVEEKKMRLLEEKILETQSRAFVCPSCLELVREDFLFCPNCGLNIRKECPSCHRALEIVWTQCPFCGVPVGTPTLPPVKEALQLAAEKPKGSFFGVFKKVFTAPPMEPSEVKRKRGRPRKAVSVVATVKRGRGRPRKDAQSFNA